MPRLIRHGLVVLAVGSVPIAPVSRAEPRPYMLFTETTQPPEVDPSADAAVVRSHIVGVDFEPFARAGGPSDSATRSESQASEVTLVARPDDGILQGSISTPGGEYAVRYAGNDVHAIVQVNQAAYAPD